MFKLSFQSLLAILGGLAALIALAGAAFALRSVVLAPQSVHETPLLDKFCQNKPSRCSQEPSLCTADVDATLHVRSTKVRLKDGEHVLRIYSKTNQTLAPNEVLWKIVVGSDTNTGLSTYDFAPCSRELSNREDY